LYLGWICILLNTTGTLFIPALSLYSSALHLLAQISATFVLFHYTSACLLFRHDCSPPPYLGLCLQSGLVLSRTSACVGNPAFLEFPLNMLAYGLYHHPIIFHEMLVTVSLRHPVFDHIMPVSLSLRHPYSELRQSTLLRLYSLAALSRFTVLLLSPNKTCYNPAHISTPKGAYNNACCRYARKALLKHLPIHVLSGSQVLIFMDE